MGRSAEMGEQQWHTPRLCGVCARRGCFSWLYLQFTKMRTHRHRLWMGSWVRVRPRRTHSTARRREKCRPSTRTMTSTARRMGSCSLVVRSGVVAARLRKQVYIRADDPSGCLQSFVQALHRNARAPNLAKAAKEARLDVETHTTPFAKQPSCMDTANTRTMLLNVRHHAASVPKYPRQL